MTLNGGFCGGDWRSLKKSTVRELERRRTGKPGPPLRKIPKNLVRGVAAEEGVGLPVRARRSVRAVKEQAAGKFLVGRRGLQIDRLVYVITWGVIAVG